MPNPPLFKSGCVHAAALFVVKCSIGLMVKSDAASGGSRVRFPADKRNFFTWGLDVLRLSPNPLLSRLLLRDG